MRTRTASILIAMVVAGIGAVLPVVPASAATVGCGNVCDNKDPQNYVATVGDGAGRCGYSTWASTLDTAYGVELRYSSYCRTAWVRDTNPGSLAYATIESFNANGTLRKVYDTRSSVTSGPYSPMVNDKNLKARACKFQWDSEYETDKPARRVGCTGKF